MSRPTERRRPPVDRYVTSPYRGVHWCSSKQLWRAEIEVNGTRHRLGRHESMSAAAEAYDAAAVKFCVPERCNFDPHRHHGDAP